MIIMRLMQLTNKILMSKTFVDIININGLEDGMVAL